MDARNEREACLAFIHARPGWTTATDLERRLDDLQLTADAEFSQDLQVAQAQLAAHAAPAGHVRLYGLPAHATQHWWFGRAQLPGRAFTLRAPDFQRVPGLSVLVLDLPWKGGVFLPVELMTPAGRTTRPSRCSSGQTMWAVCGSGRRRAACRSASR